MANEIEHFIAKCNLCNMFKASNFKAPLLSHDIPTLPYEKVASDILTFAGRLLRYRGLGYRRLLKVV